MVPRSEQIDRPRVAAAAVGAKDSRAGLAVGLTVGGPVVVFATGFGLARDAQVTGWLLLALLIAAGGYGIVRWLLRSRAGRR